MPSVFDYQDYRAFLKDWLFWKKQVQPGYSAAIFARKAGIKAHTAARHGDSRRAQPQLRVDSPLREGFGPAAARARIPREAGALQPGAYLRRQGLLLQPAVQCIARPGQADPQDARPCRVLQPLVRRRRARARGDRRLRGGSRVDLPQAQAQDHAQTGAGGLGHRDAPAARSRKSSPRSRAASPPTSSRSRTSTPIPATRTSSFANSTANTSSAPRRRSTGRRCTSASSRR